MKQKPLTLKQMEKAFKTASDIVGTEKIIGYIGGVPVIERKDCPPGVIYALDMDQFKLED